MQGRGAEFWWGPKTCRSETSCAASQTIVKSKVMVLETWHLASNNIQSILFVIKDVPRNFLPEMGWKGPQISIKGQKMLRSQTCRDSNLAEIDHQGRYLLCDKRRCCCYSKLIFLESLNFVWNDPNSILFLIEDVPGIFFSKIRVQRASTLMKGPKNCHGAHHANTQSVVEGKIVVAETRN